MKTVQREYEINATQPVFKGHFPGQPILPGVLSLSLIKATITNNFKKNYEISHVIKMKFIAPILPESKLAVLCQIQASESATVLRLDCTIKDGTQIKVKTKLELEYCDEPTTV